MSTITITLPRPRLGRTPLVGLACGFAGALAATALLALTHASPARPAVYSAPGHAFRVALPQGWRATSPATLAGMPGSPLAVLRSADGRGAVVVAQAPGGGAAAVAEQLSAQLARRFRPFKALAARTVATRAGTAYLYAFAHGSAVQSVAVASLGGRTYTINGVVASGANTDAQQIGAIAASFGA